MMCDWCKEEILPGQECHAIKGEYHFHHECGFRQIGGSVGHIRRKCSCFGGTEEDPPGMTLREAAKASLAEWCKLNPPRIEDQPILRKGDVVRVRVETEWHEAAVALASPNGDSLALILPHAVALRDGRGGMVIGPTVLLLRINGDYHELVTNKVVEVEAKCDEEANKDNP